MHGNGKLGKRIASVAAAVAALLGTAQADAGSWAHQLMHKAADQVAQVSQNGDSEAVPQIVLQPTGEAADATGHTSHSSHSSHSSHRSHSSHYSG